MTQDASYLSLARITRTQGLDGTVRIALGLEDDRYFKPGRAVILTSKAAEREAEIQFFRRQHGRCVLKIRGIDSIDEAEKVIGSEVRIRRNDMLPPEEGSFYTFQLKGCRVFHNNEDIGVITDVLDMGGSEILKVDLDDVETLIPFAQSFMKKIDLPQRRVDVDLPEGLRDINK